MIKVGMADLNVCRAPEALTTLGLGCGVRHGDTTPRPPVISSMYWHFAYISLDFCASACPIPATLRIFVYV